MWFWAPATSTSPRKFILSRDCISMPSSIAGLEESHTKTLRIDDLESDAIIYSHDFESVLLTNASSKILEENFYASYPLAFSCEVVVHAPIDNGRIMLTFESFFIPSSDQTCKDDFLYVFDSNTARSKAMPEAGGEQGLCLSQYPKIPVFSSKSYICIAFHTSNSPRSQVPKSEALRPGFKIIVTAFQESQTSACPEGRFHCDSVKNAAFAGIQSVINYSGGSVESRSSSRLPSMGICVSERVRCDGVFNCLDGRDESPSLCNHFRVGGSTDHDTSFLNQFLSLGLTTSVSVVVAAVLFIVLFLGCLICLCCCRNRPNIRTTNSSTPVVNTVFNGVNRACSGELVVPHADPSSLLNGVRKSPDAFHSQILPSSTQHQQMILPPAKSMGDLFHPHQLPPSSPMLTHFQEYPLSSQPPPQESWNAQPICYSTAHHPQWLPQQQQKQHHQQVGQQLQLPSQKQASNRVSGATTMNVPSCPQQSQQQSHVLHSTRFPYQHPETSPLVADGGIVYLGEIGGGSGSGGSRLTTGSRRPRRRSGRTMDTQSSSSIGCGPSTRGAQSAEGAPRTASNSSHSIGPSWSSSRGTTANNPSANSSANICPHHHHHHHHRRRRHCGSGGSSGKQSTRNHSTNSSEKIAFPVEL